MLKIAPRVSVSEWVPDKYEPPMLLIALPMENERIVRALARFARELIPVPSGLSFPAISIFRMGSDAPTIRPMWVASRISVPRRFGGSIMAMWSMPIASP